MDHLDSTTTEHRKGQHRSFEHRVLIQTRLKDSWNPNKIAKEIGCAPNTVRNEIKYGTVALYKGNILRYKATAGQATYDQNRQVCCRHYDFLEKVDFISFVEKKFFEDGWSLDTCVGYALKEDLFTRGQIVCTKTLYGYADLGLLGIKNIHLPEKLRRSSKNLKTHKDKRVLGRSIEERPAEANDRSKFGHWEADLVIGSKKKDDDALLTMLKRKTREYWMIWIPGRNPNGVMAALKTVRSQYSEHWDNIFKTITIDRGIEFSNPDSLETGIQSEMRTSIYYCDPMCSNQKACCERNHEYIRKVLPKKSSFDSLTSYDIRKLCWHINSTKRASLNGQSPIKLASLLLPKEIFEALDLREIPCNEINLTPTLLK